MLFIIQAQYPANDDGGGNNNDDYDNDDNDDDVSWQWLAFILINIKLVNAIDDNDIAIDLFQYCEPGSVISRLFSGDRPDYERDGIDYTKWTRQGNDSTFHHNAQVKHM